MFKVKNWDEFQHYKDRRPPWIKLHRTILEDRKWFKLSYASRALALCIWLIASEHEDHLSGIIPEDIEDLAFRARMDEKEVVVCMKELIKQGFIIHIPEHDSDLLANCYQDATPETEAYSKEVEEEAPLPPKGGSEAVKVSKMPSEFAMTDGTLLNFDQLFERLWVLYPAIRDKGNKAKAKEQLKIKIEKGIDYEIIGRGIAKYRGYCDRTGEKQPDMFRWLRDNGFQRDYTTTEQPANTRNGGGYSIEAVLEKALADKTHDPAGRDARLAALGIRYDTSDQ